MMEGRMDHNLCDKYDMMAFGETVRPVVICTFSYRTFTIMSGFVNYARAHLA